MARKGIYLEVLVFAVCRTVSEFSFYRTVSFSAKNCTIKLVFRCAFFFTSYYTVFSINGNFSVSFGNFSVGFGSFSPFYGNFSVRFGSFSPCNGNFSVH